jgi:protein phosphatase
MKEHIEAINGNQTECRDGRDSIVGEVIQPGAMPGESRSRAVIKDPLPLVGTPGVCQSTPKHSQVRGERANAIGGGACLSSGATKPTEIPMPQNVTETHSVLGLKPLGLASVIGPRPRLEDSGFAVSMLGQGALGSSEVAILGVFDGVGGRSGGDDASSLAARACVSYLCRWAGQQFGAPIESQRSGEAARDALIQASNHVQLHASRKVVAAGASTTAVIALLHEDWAAYAWVGDSRAYLARRGDIARLSTDHTAAQSLYEDGLIGLADLAEHPESHTLTCWLGGDCSPEVSVGMRGLNPGDTLVLVSDGVHGVLADHVIAAIVAHASSAQEAADRLVAAALLHGTTDNATAACCRVDSTQELSGPSNFMPAIQTVEGADHGHPQDR